MEVLWFLILMLPVAYAIAKILPRWFRTIQTEMRREWRHVPRPNWACKRGWGHEYW